MPRWKKKVNRAERQYRQSVDDISEDDIHSAADKGSRKVFDMGEKPPSTLKGLWEDIKLMVALIRDYARGDYRQIPWTSIASIAGAVLYFVNPFDIIPDFIPIAGYLDDAAVIALALKLIGDDLLKYRDWRTKQKFDGICVEGIDEVEFEEVEPEAKEPEK